ncbi:alpha/beta hydrolase [Roseomonas sp. KE2513]|uniref:alpha/beta fold hydrolase n=1 Tax=Roseomonas sp. KE2513 TaxID=2479202 RepID=UPI0018E039AA|nr:alpha/beta hydrolase [Roseomonas sp. KE2513]MBI0539197.1 alpha/beta hydrolase [Roseomonas sp. KE2513]
MTVLTPRTVQANDLVTQIFEGGAGNGPAVVLLHGGTPGLVPYAGGSHLWGALPETLARTRRVIAIDAAGSGGTPAGDGPLTVEVMARHAAAAVAAVADGPVHLVGHDLGGLVGALVALDQPGLLASLAIVASAAAAPSGDGVDNLTFLGAPEPASTRQAQFWAFDRMSYAHHHIDSTLLDGSVAAAESEAHRAVLRRMANPAAAAALTGSVLRAKFGLFRAAREAAFPVPTQIIAAAEDPLVSRDHMLWLFRIIAQHQSATQFHLINRSGSFPFREQPEAFLHVLTAFQDGLLAMAA